MNNIINLNNDTINIYKLKNYLNKQLDKDNLYLIMANYILLKYPDRRFNEIMPYFFKDFNFKNPNILCIYIILSYKLGLDYVSLDEVFKIGIINSLLKYDISIYNIHKVCKIFIDKDIHKMVYNAYYNELIKVEYIYELILESDSLNKEYLLNIINKFINENKQLLFNKNYTFFNIYKCLKKLTILRFYEENTTVIDLIPLFNTIEDDNLKIKIQNDFKHIEENDVPLIKKFEDCLTVAYKYSYELPLARKKEKKN